MSWISWFWWGPVWWSWWLVALGSVAHTLAHLATGTPHGVW